MRPAQIFAHDPNYKARELGFDEGTLDSKLPSRSATRRREGFDPLAAFYQDGPLKGLIAGLAWRFDGFSLSIRIVGNVRAPLCTRCRGRDHNVRRCTEPAHLTAIVDVKAGPSTHHYTPRTHAHHAGNSKGERWGRVLAYMWLGV